jgi:hypothetical protein
VKCFAECRSLSSITYEAGSRFGEVDSTAFWHTSPIKLTSDTPPSVPTPSVTSPPIPNPLDAEFIGHTLGLIVDWTDRILRACNIVPNTSIKKAFEILLQILEKMDRSVSVSYFGEFKNDVQVLKYSLSSTITFKLKFSPSKHSQLLSRLLVIPIQKANCNSNRIAMVGRMILWVQNLEFSWISANFWMYFHDFWKCWFHSLILMVDWWNSWINFHKSCPLWNQLKIVVGESAIIVWSVFIQYFDCIK